MTMRISKDRIDLDDKVLQKPVLKDYGETLVGGASGTNTTSSYTVNLVSGNVFNLILNANCSFTFSNPPPSGTAGGFTLILTQDATGSRTVTWPAAVKWSGGTAPTLSTAADAVDIFSFLTVDGGTTWFGFVSGAIPPEEFSVAFMDSDSSATNATTFNFTSLDFGAPHENRRIFVVWGGAASTTTTNVSSMTIGGESATLATGSVNSIADYAHIGMGYVDLPTGSTGDVSITFNAEYRRCAVLVYRIGQGAGLSLSGAGSGNTATSLNTNVGGTRVADDIVLAAHYALADEAINWSANQGPAFVEDTEITVESTRLSAGTWTAAGGEVNITSTGSGSSSVPRAQFARTFY